MRLAALAIAAILGGALSVTQPSGVASGTNNASTAAHGAPGAVNATVTPNPTRPRDPGRWDPRPSHVPTSTRILALGDSITLGAGSTDGTGYRGPLAAMLTGETWLGPEGTAPLRHAGRSGWRIDQWVPLARDLAQASHASVILVDLGTNDAGRDHDETAAQMLAETRTLVDQLRDGWGGAVILLAQPTITTINTPAQQHALRDFGDQLPSLAAGYQRVWVVDMRGVPLGDGVHPNDQGYTQMAQRWYAAMRTAGVA